MTTPATTSPLSRFNRERQAIINEVIERVTRTTIQASWDSPGARLDNLLNEAAFFELSRHEQEGGSRGDKLTFWKQVVHTLARSTEEENAELVRKVITDYTRETAGHFRPGVQRFALDVLPRSLSLLAGVMRGNVLPSLESLEERMVVEGEIARVRRLAEIGTLVFVSTHVSRLDAGLLGLGLHLAKLPATVHGADSTLFSNPMTAFFMANLGAYKVDRSLKHTLYTRVLKTYSQVILERGYHSFFFPTGGRSRDNRIDERLKLGLLGTSLDAWSRGVVQGDEQPLFVVPVTMNYNLVLEAETLVADAMNAQGATEVRIIQRDEFSDPRRVASWLASALQGPDFMTIRFGEPMDPFGNEVSPDGISLDQKGRAIDPTRYLWRGGVPVEDSARARAYTRGLGEKVVDSWRRNNVIYPLHIVSMALFDYVCRQHPSWDVDRLLWFARGDSINRSVAEGETERVMRIVRRDAAEGRLRLSNSSEKWTAQQMVDEALRFYRAYHSSPVVEVEQRELRLSDLRLLNYYGNRLRGYDIERRLGATPGGV